MCCRSLRVRAGKEIPTVDIHRPGGRRHRFRSSNCFGAAAGKLVCWEVSSRVSAASELLQHFFLNLFDFVSYRSDAIQGTAQPLSFLDDLIDFIKNVTQFGVELDQRSRPFVAGLPGSGSGIAKLSGLVEKLGNLLFVAEQELADRTSNLLVFPWVTPKNMLQEEKIFFQDFRLSFQVSAGLE